MKMEKILTVKQRQLINNYVALIKAGLTKVMARKIALSLAMSVIFNVAVSDRGVHVDTYQLGQCEEKTIVFLFTPA